MHSHWAEGSRNMNSGQLLEQAWVRLQRYLAPQKTAAKIGPTQPLCQSAGGGLRQFFARIPPGSPSGKYWAKRQRPSRASFGSRIGGGFLKEKGYSTLSFVQKFNFIIVEISFAKKNGENVGKMFCFWWENVLLSFLSQNFWERTAWVTWAFYSAIYWHVPGLGFGAFGRRSSQLLHVHGLHWLFAGITPKEIIEEEDKILPRIWSFDCLFKIRQKFHQILC